MSTIPKLRVARPSDNLEIVAAQYQNGLGFDVLARFEDHQGFDGVILGKADWPYHLEFTSHIGSKVGTAPTKDNLLVFYLSEKAKFTNMANSMVSAGFKKVVSFNPYWDKEGITYEDVDGYRVVLQNCE